MTEKEEWRPVVGFEGFYEVSSLGRVRSLDRYVWGGGRGGYKAYRLRRGRVLSPAINRKRGGYRQVGLRAHGKQIQRRVAVLVGLAFLGPRPEGLQLRHINGDAQDDRVVNLRYGTPKENAADKERHGTLFRGQDAPNARLTEADVRHILTSKERSEILGAKYGVHWGHINNIRRGVRWAHVRV